MSENQGSTTTIRTNHTFWGCNQPLSNVETCSGRMDMGTKQCAHCGIKRGPGDAALTDYGRKIGHLLVIDVNGAEYWQYFE
ncbi:hypothetical protein FZEAL_3624 [Fusarium zealandicum]|uniref:Uncharacterized protein n=1 Tax=Fusarium zealandicum TaxID=1053134 RepID=A0A8H4UNZ0_9HYPO|nr:hypothetical protein FZEAL_3624 [Fusarium zealandicum]